MDFEKKDNLPSAQERAQKKWQEAEEARDLTRRRAAALKEKEHQIKVEYIEDLIESLQKREERPRLREADAVLINIGNQMEKMAELGLEEERQELEALRDRVFEQRELYKE
jgi:hypothetical protein